VGEVRMRRHERNDILGSVSRKVERGEELGDED
jgi:hypothetical protein